MKNLLVIVLTLIMVFTLAACGSDNSTTDPGTDNPTDQTADSQQDADTNDIDWSNLKSGTYAEIMMSNQYYMEYTSHAMGFEVKSKTAADGANYDTISEVMGITTRTLTLDGMVYDIDILNNTYTETTVDEGEEQMNELGFDYSALQYQGNGNGAIPGFEEIDTNSYDYEEYAIEIEYEGSPMTINMRYYLNDSGLYAIYIDLMGFPMIMEITTLTSDIPADMLQLPEGYTKVDQNNYSIPDIDLPAVE